MTLHHTIRDKGKQFKTVSLTPMKAIRLFCTECMGFQVLEIKECTDKHCPVFPYREGHNLSRQQKKS